MCSPRCLPPKEGAFFLDLSSEKKKKRKKARKRGERLQECLRTWEQSSSRGGGRPAGPLWPQAPRALERAAFQMIKLIDFKHAHLEGFCHAASTSHPHQLRGSNYVLWCQSQGPC